MTDTNREEMITDTLLEINDTVKEVKSRLSRLSMDFDGVVKRIRLMEAGLEKEIRDGKEETVWTKKAVHAILVHLGQSEPEKPAS